MINVICLSTKCKQENMAGQGIQDLLVSTQCCKCSTWGLFLIFYQYISFVRRPLAQLLIDIHFHWQLWLTLRSSSNPQSVIINVVTTPRQCPWKTIFISGIRSTTFLFAKFSEFMCKSLLECGKFLSINIKVQSS